LFLAHSPTPHWLPSAVAVGCLAHIVGDALTCEGVPVPLIWIVHRCRIHPIPMRTGTAVEKLFYVPLFFAATLVFLYLNTGVHTAVQPVVAHILGQG
jgi:membrane-bound metal-dependent hydrolase YbcI (DUF457 family)